MERFCPTLLPGQLTSSPRQCVYQAAASVRETVVEEMAAFRLPLCPLLPEKAALSVVMKAVKSHLPHFPRCWFLFDSFFFSVIQAPNIHIDSYDENSLSFTLTMDGDIKVTWSSQTGSWVGLSFV